MPLAINRAARRPKPVSDNQQTAVFATNLGWIGLAMRQQSLVRLVFGYADAQAAIDGLTLALGGEQTADQSDPDSPWLESLRSRLLEFAEGQADDFLDVAICSETWTPFQQLVLTRCRQIPYGETRTYAELAALAGKPGAARAIGRAMATNPVPLVIPCHRVVGSAGDLRGFSAVGGLDAKRRLLELEHDVPLSSRRQPAIGDGAIAGKISHAVRQRTLPSPLEGEGPGVRGKNHQPAQHHASPAASKVAAK
jgi:methylated-DNA-[protein]-cysteine S-methyltransferase